MKNDNTKNIKDRHPRIGDIYYMRFCGDGSEQSGWRPGVVWSNNTGNIYSPNIIALPITSSLKKLNQPTHVVLNAKSAGLNRDSMVLCENPERMSKEKIGDYISTLPDEAIAEIAAASILASSAISYLDADTLTALWHKSISLNAATVA